MKTKIIKTIAALMLSFLSLPMMGQDFMEVYFKDGIYKKFYLEGLMEWKVSQYDADGVKHSDYNYQHIKTNTHDFVFELEKIDSIVFTKFDEEKVKQDFDAAMTSVLSVLSENITAEEVETKLDFIKNSESVEDAWCSGHILFVDVRNCGTINFYLYEDIVDDEETEDDINLANQMKAYIPQFKQMLSQNGRTPSIVVANQNHYDLSRTNRLKVYEKILDEFGQCGFDTTYLARPTIDFFATEMYNYDLILFISHGCYNDETKNHSFITGELLGSEIPISKNSDASEELIDECRKRFRELNETAKYRGIETVKISFQLEEGESGNVLRGYPSISEDFFGEGGTSQGSFRINSIFFNGCCQMFNGTTTETATSFADKFVKVHGLRLFLGYKFDNHYSPWAGSYFFRSMLCGKSTESAFNEVESKYKSKEKFLTGAELLFRRNDNDNGIFFITPTITSETDPETVKSDYYNSKVVSVKGYTTSLDLADIKCGFLYSTNKDFSSAINVIDNAPVKVSKPFADGRGNVVFRYDIKDLQPGNTYHYCAYTYDGKHYNYGNALSFYVPFELQLSTQDLSLIVGSTTTVEITSGNGDYTVSVDKPNNATATLSGTTITITGVAAGTAKVTVKDKSGQTAEINVKVWDNLTLSQSSVGLYPGNSTTVEITNGSGHYSVSVDKPAVATASLSGSKITIKGVGVGSAVVTVTDTSTNQTANINVTVSSAPTLVVSNSSVNLIVGGSSTVEITSGSGSYEISNSNTRVVQAVLEGAKITLTAKSEGNAVVTVKDKSTGQTASVSITVKPIPNLVLSQSTIELTIGAEATVEIVTGSGEYSVAIDNPSIATVSLSGSVITVKGIKSGSAAVTITDTVTGQNQVLFVNVSLNYVPAEAIDLGLPSGIKWASWNVGASAPEEAGGYYAWGETEEKDYYDWDTYSLYDVSSSTYHYIGNDIAGTQYDVAHVKWGGSWRMPTNDQINELLNNCTWTWTTRNEVDGELVTGPNGATIFLPAADRRVRDIGGDASRGYYWTSLVDPSVIGRAYALDFYNVNNNRYFNSNDQRRMGCSVRPVYSDDPPQNLSISADCIIMDKGDTTIVKITSGSGRYELTNTNNNIIVAKINYSEITVIAKAGGRAVLTVKDTYSDQTAEINVLVVRPISYVPAETVDLGLPSGTLWASWNVGAVSPDDIGGYYAWGETEEKDSYNWSTYIHCDGTGETYHNIGDDISGTEYDVAHVKWGGSWRMPSLDQIFELTDNCTQLWTTQNGVKGMLLTGPSGKSIFLPASGYRRDSHLHNGVTDGLYWSSLLYTDNKYAAIYLHFASDVGLGAIERCFGLSVRPVINGLAISDNNIELMYGNSTTVEIISGSGNYEISNSDANVVQAVLNGTTITLTAKAEGRAIVTVKDIEYNQTIDVPVTVNLANICISRSNVKLSVGKSSTVEITSGNGSYELSNSNEDIVQAVIDSTTITLTAIADGNAIVTIKDVISGETIDLSVNVIIYTPSEPIDLGLPSGTKWASWNVGASKPEEYGGYYAWGETEEKDYYDWSTYTHCDGTGQTCHNIGTDIAGTEYDAAQMNWGGPWRMPTKDQMDELASKCTREWTQQNGVNGFLVTGPNGNTIFLPAAGFWEGGEHKRGADEGEYWSSTFDNYYMNRAYILNFDSGHFRSSFRNLLYYGYTVRPVISKLIISKQNVGLIVGDSTIIEITSGSGTYEISISNEDIVHAVLDSTSITLTAIADGKAVVTVKDFEQTIDINVFVSSSDCPVAEAVDLGLPSGTKWASWNVGAFFPEESGANYAWGETEEKDYYDWSNYKWCNGTDSTLTKYCTNSSYGYNGFTDGLTELLPEDDAATVNWGAPWHMPTSEQIHEFQEYCTSEWTQLNGVGGRLFVGPNGNTIFLPYGLFLSSSLNLYNENRVLSLFSGYDGFTVLPTGSTDRCRGFMVRPVCP